MHDLIDPPRRHPDRDGELVLGDTERGEEFFGEDLTGWIGAVGVVAVICGPPF
jgi:hypothetical protein